MVRSASSSAAARTRVAASPSKQVRDGHLDPTPNLTSPRLSGAPMADLVELLAAQPVSCRLWPEQTEGPYDRPANPERRDITEDRVGLELRIGLRLVDARSGAPLVGMPVEVWHADHGGRYAG